MALQEMFIYCWDTIAGTNAMISQDFYRIDSDLSKGQVFLQLCKNGFSRWGGLSLLGESPVDLSAACGLTTATAPVVLTVPLQTRGRSVCIRLGHSLSTWPADMGVPDFEACLVTYTGHSVGV